jgi:hypothetical protein
MDLLYTIGVGRHCYRAAARLAVRSARKYGRFRGDVVVLADRDVGVDGYGDTVVVRDPGDLVEPKSLVLKIGSFVDLARYDRVVFIDSDVLVCRSLEALMDHAQHALVATDDVGKTVAEGYNHRCLTAEELRAHGDRLAVNSGFFIARGSHLDAWLEEWRRTLEMFESGPAVGIDQDGLNAAMVRGSIPVLCVPGLMWWPRRAGSWALTVHPPYLIHYHNLGRKPNRLLYMHWRFLRVGRSTKT